MPDYTASFECLDIGIDWNTPGVTDADLTLDNGGLTETKLFLNKQDGSRHNTLDLVGMWMQANQFADVVSFGRALFEHGSEEKFKIKTIVRPQAPGEKGQVDFELGFDAGESWMIQTDKGLLAPKKIRLAMRLALLPVH